MRHATVTRVEQPRPLQASEIKLGSVVGLSSGGPVTGPVVVVADLGNIGYRGHRLYTVRGDIHGYDDVEIDIPLQWIVEMPPPEKPRKSRARKRAAVPAK
jgi:hypothetical protein